MTYSAQYHVFPTSFHVTSRKIDFLWDSVGQAYSSGLKGHQWCWLGLFDNLFGVRPTPLNMVCTTLSPSLSGLELATAPVVLVKLLYAVITTWCCKVLSPRTDMWGVVTNTSHNGMPTYLGIVRKLIHCLRQGSVADKPHTSRCPSYCIHSAPPVPQQFLQPLYYLKNFGKINNSEEDPLKLRQKTFQFFLTCFLRRVILQIPCPIPSLILFFAKNTDFGRVQFAKIYSQNYKVRKSELNKQKDKVRSFFCSRL